MNDRQRLEAIVSVVCKYLPPDGTPIKEAMSEIISLIDPLPEQPERPWVGLTDGEIGDAYVAWDDTDGASFADFARAIEQALKDKNT